MDHANEAMMKGKDGGRSYVASRARSRGFPEPHRPARGLANAHAHFVHDPEEALDHGVGGGHLAATEEG